MVLPLSAFWMTIFLFLDKCLKKCLNFSVKPNSIEYPEFLIPFELLFRDVKQENLCSEGLSLMKARLLNSALSSYESFSSDGSPS